MDVQVESLDSISEVDMVSASVSGAEGGWVHTGPVLGQEVHTPESLGLTTPCAMGMPTLVLQVAQEG